MIPEIELARRGPQAAPNAARIPKRGQPPDDVSWRFGAARRRVNFTGGEHRTGETVLLPHVTSNQKMQPTDWVDQCRKPG
jgi:hypothetical protein